MERLRHLSVTGVDCRGLRRTGGDCGDYMMRFWTLHRVRRVFRPKSQRRVERRVAVTRAVRLRNQSEYQV